jgi:hypothetical protein
MKSILPVLLGLGFFTFLFTQCKTSESRPKAKELTPETIAHSAVSTEVVPAVANPTGAALATIDAAQAYIQSPNPCEGLNPETCKKLTKAATESAKANPKVLAENLTQKNLTDIQNSITPKKDGTEEEVTTGSDSNTGAKVAVGLGVPLLVISGLVAFNATVATYVLHKEEIIKQIESEYTKKPKASTNGEEIDTKDNKKMTGKIAAIASISALVGLGSMAYGASVLNSSDGMQLAEGAKTDTPALIYLKTLNAIGQQVMNNYN